MHWLRLWACGGVALAVLSVFAACGGNSFSAASGGDAGGDASTADGPVVDAGHDGGGDDGAPGEGGEGGGDASPDAPAGDVVYVAPTGDDTKTGLDPAHPKRTIVSALGEAGKLGAGAEVHVCAGTYSEAKLSIGADVKLLGAYDCKTWTRTATFGWPKFDGVNQTTIADADPTVQAATLLIQASVSGVVTSATVVSGFVIAGSTPTSGTSLAVHVGESAAPRLTDDLVAGGSGQTGTTGVGSQGVLVDGLAAPEIAHCVIDGGSGSGAQGSIGVLLNTSGAVSLHDVVVSGGTGTAAAATDLASVGVDVRASTSKPLASLLVSGGSHKQGATGGVAGVRILAPNGGGTSADVVGSTVAGETGSAPATVSYGVLVDAGTGSVQIVGDRIFGGLVQSQGFGVSVTQAGSVAVSNSMIHAGEGGLGVGVHLGATTSPTIADDPIYTGGGAGAAVGIDGTVSGAALTDDLLVGSDSTTFPGSTGVFANDCSGSIATLDHSAFANFGSLYVCGNGGTNGKTAQTIADLQSDLGSSASNDVLVQPTCTGGDPTCAAVANCPSPGQSCPSSLFGASWSANDDGTSSLTTTTGSDGGVDYGWELQPGAPCTLAEGGASISSIPTDVDGQARDPSHPTIGATEYVSATQCAD